MIETDIHHPTGFNLLWDSVRSLVRDASRACDAFGVPGWRKRDYWSGEARHLFRQADTAHRWSSRPAEVRAFPNLSLDLAGKAEGSLNALARKDCPRRNLDRIERRVLQGKAIPHHEKVFSIHGEHTRWIAKGKGGKPAELGVPVAVLDDGTGFVPGHGIMREGGDTDVAVPLAGQCRAGFPELHGCSFDRGLHSPANRRVLDAMLEVNALPRKGRLSEAEPAFAAARRRHSGIESAVNNPKHRGLGRARLHGRKGFELAVGLSVPALNIHRIGMVLRDREQERLRKQRERQRKRAA